jgi:tRNA threonylcarbamoyladenosine biosynthesis protein TsaB
MKSSPAASAQPSCVAWDTSGHALVIAATHRGRKAETRSSGLAYHSEKLFITLEARSRALGMDLSKLDFVAVGRGPGSFTGVRVGVTAAKTLCYASGARLIMLSSLEIIAANLREEKRRVCVVQDARRNRLFTAAYQNGVCVRAPRLVHTGDFLFQLESGTIYTGDAVMMFADTLSRKYGRGAVIRDRRLWSPQPGTLLKVALEHWNQQSFSDPLKAVPEYLYEDTCNVTQPNPSKRQPR